MMKLTRLAVISTVVLTILASACAPRQARAEDPDSSINLHLFVSCDAQGHEKHNFQKNENVYVKDGWFRKNQEVSIYVLRNGDKPENAISGPVNIAANDKGHLPVTCVWSAPLTPGEYDVWIDANQNGKFDAGDRLYYIWCFYLFHVVPEVFAGSIGATVAMFGSFAIYRLRRTRKP